VPSCALDVASEGPHTHEDVAALVGLGRARIQQIEKRALDKLRKRAKHFGLELGLIIERPRHTLDVASLPDASDGGADASRLS
jgi:hypothetical protein